MKNIEIKTTQNVVLQYELADLKDRVLAFIIDLFCVFVGLWFLGTAGSAFVGNSETMVMVLVVFLTAVFIFYPLAMEVWNNGQTVGKMAMKIQVIQIRGGKATFSDYAARWVFSMIDIYFSLGGIAAILVASSSKAQRIGDIVANTAVIKIIPRVNIDLKDLLSIHSNSTYTPVYQQARHLAEEDVLLIKTTLDRYSKHRNDAHVSAIQTLAAKIQEILEVENVSKDSRHFLQTILYDYVVLTR